jgi:hypothetical protein
MRILFIEKSNREPYTFDAIENRRVRPPFTPTVCIEIIIQYN